MACATKLGGDDTGRGDLNDKALEQLLPFKKAVANEKIFDVS